MFARRLLPLCATLALLLSGSSFATQAWGADQDYDALDNLLSKLENHPALATTSGSKTTLRTVKAPESVTVESVDNAVVITAPNALDAINTAVNRKQAGCVQVRFGSGFGWVATGAASYGDFENPTAVRISKRNAYVKAFIEAKSNLAMTLNGLSSAGKDEVRSALAVYSDSNQDLTNLNESTTESIAQAANALLRGFAVYEVEDDTDTNTVYVSIVSSPKTRALIERPSPAYITADTLEKGLNAIFVEIQTGVVPPVGARTIRVRGTENFAFVGFGSDVIRYNARPPIQAKLKDTAQKVAQMRARDALLGAITGDNTKWQAAVDEETKETLNEFERAVPADGSGIKAIEGARQQFHNQQIHQEAMSSVRAGNLPPGIRSKSWIAQGDGVAYALAIWLPVAQEVPKPAPTPNTPVEQFPTGQVTQADDLATTNPSPLAGTDWLTQRPSDPNFLFGIGSAPATVAQAQKQSTSRSYLDIVSQLFVSVGGDTTVSDKTVMITSESGDSVESVQAVHDNVRMTVPFTALIGAEIVDQKTQDGIVYTLTRLSKPDFVSVINARIAEIDSRLRTISPLPATADSNFVRSAMPLLPLFHERLGNTLLLQALQQPVPAAPFNTGTFKQLLGRLINGNEFLLSGNAPTVRSILVQNIDRLGLVGKDSGTTSFEVRLSESHRTRIVGEWHRVTLTGTVEIVDRASQQVLGAMTKSVEKSSTQGEAESLDRAQQALATDLGEKIRAEFLTILLNTR